MMIYENLEEKISYHGEDHPHGIVSTVVLFGIRNVSLPTD